MSKTFWFGLILLIIGIVVALAGPSLVQNRDTYGVGDASVTVTDRNGIPSWVGWVVTGIGVVIMLSGIRRRHDDSNVTVVRDTLIHEDHRPHTP
jgi:hypothetical protein